MFGYGITVSCMAILAGFFPPAAASADHDSTFNVTSFIPERFTDFQWKLDGRIQAKGLRNEHVYPDSIGAIRTEHVTTEDEQLLDVTSNLAGYHETANRQYSWSLIARYDLHNASPHSRFGDLSSADPGIYPSISVRHYLVSNLHLSLAASGGWTYDHNLHDVNPDTYHRQYTINAQTGPGWGRLYDGRFAATAMYIIDELRGNGLILRSPTAVEMRDLCMLVYSGRLVHPVDKRLHKIEVLQTIMRFLEKHAIARQTGPYGYLLIQDVWDYFPNEARWFGNRVGFGWGIDYLYSTDQTTNEYTNSTGTRYHIYHHHESETHKPYFEPVVDLRAPIDLRWQFEVTAAWRYYLKSFLRENDLLIDYSPTTDLTENESSTNTEANHTFWITAGLIYLPDSRTSVRIMPRYTISHSHQDKAMFHTREDLSWNAYRESQESEMRLLEIHGLIEYRLALPTILRFDFWYLREDRTICLHYGRFEDAHEYNITNYYITTSIEYYLF